MDADSAHGADRNLQPLAEQHSEQRCILSNNTEMIYSQMQYRLRRLSVLAGYTRFTQGISATGIAGNGKSYYVGISRWFDFF